MTRTLSEAAAHIMRATTHRDWSAYWPGSAEIFAEPMNRVSTTHCRAPLTSSRATTDPNTPRSARNFGWYGGGPDAGNPDPTAVRLLYADRPLTQDEINLLVRD
jgi:hypothetical protein